MNIKRGLKYGLLTFAFLKGIKEFKAILATQEEQIKELEQKISKLKEVYTPIRFQIIARDRANDTITVSLKFYTQNGRIIKQANGDEYIRFTLEGQEIAFDFIVVPFGEYFIAFPNKIFTDAIAPAYGKTLFPYYTAADGSPLIFYPFANDDEKKAYISLFSQVKTNPDAIPGAFGSVVQDVNGVKLFEVGQTYRINVHTRGGIEVIKE